MGASQHTQWARLIQSQHPEKLLPFAGNLNDRAISAVFGMDEEMYREIKQQFTRQARMAAEQLLEEQVFATQLDQLPFRPADVVVGIGESTTDDLLSWLEILRHTLELRRPQDRVSIVNEGVSGFTTTQLLGRIGSIAAKQPDWILCLIGSNDTLRIGPVPGIRQVSAQETARNLAAVRSITAARTRARWVWLTPPGFDESRADAYPYFQQAGLSWRNEEILVVGQMIRGLGTDVDLVVDVQSALGVPVQKDWIGPDGVHPTLTGQQKIVRELVAALAEAGTP